MRIALLSDIHGNLLALEAVVADARRRGVDQIVNLGDIPPDARYAIVERTAQGWLTESISVPYDHEAMARIASRNGREDWARWLRTGWADA